jgi:hypothetical protein
MIWMRRPILTPRKVWIEEAQRRYDAFLAGEMPAHPGDEVMNRARDRLK